MTRSISVIDITSLILLHLSRAHVSNPMEICPTQPKLISRATDIDTTNNDAHRIKNVVFLMVI